MTTKLKNIILITLISIVSTLVIWSPFFFRVKNFWGIPLPQNGMATIVANYDGPLFLVVAKTFYDKTLIKEDYQFPLATEYYAAHFPLFPILTKAFSFIFGFPYAMLFVTAISSILALYFFNKLAKEFVDQANAKWLTLVFAVFPARWLVVRSVGSAEPLFVGSVIASVYFFRKKNYLLCGLWGVIAQLTKSPGILLFIAYFLGILLPHLKQKAIQLNKLAQNIEITKILPIFLIPISLIGLFIFYGIRLNDYLAYFHSGDNIHLIFPPFSIFNYSAPWVGTFWLEEVIFVYLFGALGLIKLIKMKEYDIAWFYGVFFATILFVAHRDIIRYSLPLVPFIFIAFSDTLIKKEFRWVMALLIIPIYLFSLAFISQNVMPIANWAPFL